MPYNTPQSNSSLGTAGSIVSGAVRQLGALQRLTLTFDTDTGGAITLADGDHGAGKKLWTFEVGSTWILGSVFEGTVTNTANFNASPADTFSFGFGGTQAADDGTLTGTETNIGGAVSPTNAALVVDTDSGTTLTRSVDVSRARCDSWCATFVGSNGVAGEIWVNFACAAANNSGANSVRAFGTLEIIYVTMGDN